MLRSKFPVLLALALLLGLSAQATSSFNRDTIVFLGSSSIEMWQSLPQDMAPAPTLNLGRGGTTYAYLLENAEGWAERYPAKRFVIYSGDNDLAQGQRPDTVARNFRSLAHALNMAVPDARIFVLSVKPNPSFVERGLLPQVRETNQLLEEAARGLPYASFVDIFHPMLGEDEHPLPGLYLDDNVHMTGKGYEIWTRELRKLLF